MDLVLFFREIQMNFKQIFFREDTSTTKTRQHLQILNIKTDFFSIFFLFKFSVAIKDRKNCLKKIRNTLQFTAEAEPATETETTAYTYQIYEHERLIASSLTQLLFLFSSSRFI